MKILIIGDSHSATLKMAQVQMEENGDRLSGAEVVIKPLGAGRTMVPEFFIDCGNYAQIMEPRAPGAPAEVPPRDEHFDVIGYSAPLFSTRVSRMEWAKFGLPNAAEKKYFVSTSALRAIVAADVKQSLAFLDVIRRTTPVFVIEPPAPFLACRAVLSNGAEQVYYLNKFYRDHVHAELRKRDIPVVDLDPSWIEEDGFMKPQFSRDNSHGNIEFGQLMLQRIVDAVIHMQAVQTR